MVKNYGAYYTRVNTVVVHLGTRFTAISPLSLVFGLTNQHTARYSKEKFTLHISDLLYLILKLLLMKLYMFILF